MLVSSISLPSVFFYNQAGLTVQSSRTLLVQDKSEQQAGGANRERGVARADERAEEHPSSLVGTSHWKRRREPEVLQQLRVQVTE